MLSLLLSCGKEPPLEQPEPQGLPQPITIRNAAIYQSVCPENGSEPCVPFDDQVAGESMAHQVPSDFVEVLVAGSSGLSVPIYYDRCSVGRQDARPRPYPSRCHTEDCAPSNSKTAAEVIDRFIRLDWFDEAERLFLQCRESCDAYWKCNTEPGDLARMRCENLSRDLKNKLGSGAVEIVMRPTTCEVVPDVRLMEENRISLVFQFPEGGSPD